MKTQGKNQLSAILGAGKKESNLMMCSFRCDRDLWNDFAVYCLLIGKDKTGIIIDYIQGIVSENREKIEIYKNLKA